VGVVAAERDTQRPHPKLYTRTWPTGPFRSDEDPAGAVAAEMMGRIASQITYRRKFAGQNQASLAKEAGVSSYTSSRIESGSTWARWDTMMSLCGVLGVRPTLTWADDAPAEWRALSNRSVPEVPYRP
jgi:DNA-binding XRE family transcriptional regulator